MRLVTLSKRGWVSTQGLLTSIPACQGLWTKNQLWSGKGHGSWVRMVSPRCQFTLSPTPVTGARTPLESVPLSPPLWSSGFVQLYCSRVTSYQPSSPISVIKLAWWLIKANERVYFVAMKQCASIFTTHYNSFKINIKYHNMCHSCILMYSTVHECVIGWLYCYRLEKILCVLCMLLL